MQLMSCKEKNATGTKLWKTCNYGDSEDEALRKVFKINVPMSQLCRSVQYDHWSKSVLKRNYLLTKSEILT